MSSRRWARPGRVKVQRSMRARRSSRNAPSRWAVRRSRLEPAMSWKSDSTGLSAPRGRTILSSSARSSIACSSSPSSAISSRKSMPPSARLSRPSRSAIAPVKAPLRWPNRAEPAASPRTVAQLSSTKGPSTRLRAFFSSKMRRASTVLPPAPVGLRAEDQVRTVAAATWPIRVISSLKARFRVGMPAVSRAVLSARSSAKREASLS